MCRNINSKFSIVVSMEQEGEKCHWLGVHRGIHSYVCLYYVFLIFAFWVFPFLKKIYFIYLFLATLGLRCCTQAFSSCGERGLLCVAVRGLLAAVASLVAEHGL